MTQQRRRRPRQAVQAWIRPPPDPAAPAALALRQLQLVNLGRLNARVVLCQPLPLHLLVVKGALMRLRIPAPRWQAYSAPAPLQIREAPCKAITQARAHASRASRPRRTPNVMTTRNTHTTAHSALRCACSDPHACFGNLADLTGAKIWAQGLEGARTWPRQPAPTSHL